MGTLDRTLRKRLETTIRTARVVAEEGAADAIRRLGIPEDAAPAYLSEDEKALRVRLRAHARTLGDCWDKDKKRLLGTKRLRETVAYEAWHRMLFGRFLIERGLLVHPEIGVAIGRDELRELAQEEGLPDEWALVERLAAPALPAVFKPDDPVLAVVLAPEFARRLRGLVVALPEEVFAAEDSLGWTYQFWRAAEKDAVNKAGGKIGAAELPAVTQLFTEPYMVKFLLHNTLGAWWAGKVLAANPNLARDAASEQALRDACALPGVAWEFLRFVREDDGAGPWRPAAGSFPGWPERAAEITFLDPCCGSGHFLVEAFGLLAALRQAEEDLSAEDVARAVLRDNLHGLEIDGRCVQIAAFNVALAAWRLAGGPIALPQPHIAWVGAQPPPRAEMAALGNGDPALRRALEALHDQFVDAPLLGSLLDVGAKDLLDTDLRERGEAALARLRGAEPEQAEGAVTARGLLAAAVLLTKRYVLQATNVPFLGYRDMGVDLVRRLKEKFASTKGDLGYCLWARVLKSAAPNGTVGVVTLQHWLSAVSYAAFRKDLLRLRSIEIIAYLGPGAFETISGEKVNITLSLVNNCRPSVKHANMLIDVGSSIEPDAKAAALQVQPWNLVLQREQFTNPAYTIMFEHRLSQSTLAQYADCLAGIMNGDTPRFVASFWELSRLQPIWALLQSTTNGQAFEGGFSKIIYYDEQHGHLREDARIRRERLHNSDERGNQVWGKLGVAINQMADLYPNVYLVERI